MTGVLQDISDLVDVAVNGFGRRSTGADAETGDEVELLELSSALVDHPAFVAALAERVARFAAVRHASYVHLRRLDRPSPDRLVLVSDLTHGWRLSDMLATAQQAGITIDISVVIALLRQLLPAVALFGRHNRDAAIGALAPERLIVTPQARLVIAEHAFGPAIEKLNFGRDRLWRELHVTMPPSTGLPRANARADATAVGVIALSLLLGRVLLDEEFPSQVGGLLELVNERRGREQRPLSEAFRNWLSRALQLDSDTAFQSPHEAQLAFEAVLASDRSYVTMPTALEEWVAAVGERFEQAQSDQAPPESAPVADMQEYSYRPPTQDAISEQRPSAFPDSVAAAPVTSSVVSEVEPVPAPARSSARSPLLFALVAVAVIQSGVVIWLWNRDPAPAAPSGQGELVVQTRPVSARVTVDGEERGVTPLTLSLPAGSHVLEVQIGKSEPRVIPLTIRTGVQTAQYVELQNVPTVGSLEIRSEPPGARVTIDGQNRGTTPVTLKDLAPGSHTVVLEAGSRKVTQSVRIEAGVTGQLVVPLPSR